MRLAQRTPLRVAAPLRAAVARVTFSKVREKRAVVCVCARACRRPDARTLTISPNHTPQAAAPPRPLAPPLPAMASPAAGAPTADAAVAATTPPPPPCPKLTALRAAMAGAGVDAYIVPTEDPHMVSEREESGCAWVEGE